MSDQKHKIGEIEHLSKGGMRCRALRRSGYWKGWQCEHEGTFECSGLHYCYAHIGFAQEALNDPGEPV